MWRASCLGRGWGPPSWKVLCPLAKALQVIGGGCKKVGNQYEQGHKKSLGSKGDKVGHG